MKLCGIELKNADKKSLKEKDRITVLKGFYLLRNLMYCSECGSQMSGRIYEQKNERHYFCPNKTRNWKKTKPSDETRYKRGKVDGYGCDMNRSLNIPITDEFVWKSVKKVIAESSTLKEGFKTSFLS